MRESREAETEARERLGLVHRVSLPEAGTRAPIVVLVHGRSGSASSMWTFSRALGSPPAVVLAPQGFLSDGKGEFNWWDVPQDLGPRERREIFVRMLIEAEEKLGHFIREAHAVYPSDGRPCIGIGFSMGGMLLSALSLQEPELFCGVAILSGAVPQTALSTGGLIAPRVREKIAVLPNYFIGHGYRDQIVPFDKAADSKLALEEFGANVTLKGDNIGHKVSSPILRALEEWLRAQFLLGAQ